MVQLEGVGRTFEGDPPISALSGVSLTLDRGSYTAIMGPSGSGKSTLLNIVGLIDRPSTGLYSFCGFDAVSARPSELARLRALDVGFVFQAFHLIPHLEALENVALGLTYQRATRRDSLNEARSALSRVHMGHLEGADPRTLSGGEKQRVAIARAVMGSPALLLCDEPTGNLDSVNTGSILDLFDDLHESGITILVITHDPAVAARAGTILRLIDGRLSKESLPARTNQLTAPRHEGAE